MMNSHVLLRIVSLLGQETVNILNEEHLVGNTDNDNALKIMNGALADLNGRCEKVIVEE